MLIAITGNSRKGKSEWLLNMKEYSTSAMIRKVQVRTRYSFHTCQLCKILSLMTFLLPVLDIISENI